MKVLSYNKYKFLLDNYPIEFLKESSEFAQSQMNQVSNPLGPGYGFAKDPSMSIYSDDVNPYIDNYARLSQIVADLGRVMKELQGPISTSFKNKVDYFLEDVEEYQNLKILRIFENTNLKLDVYISFDFMEEEFFGVFRNFNGINEPKLDSDLFSDPRFTYINKEYYIKLKNYIYKILYNWFIPAPGDYKILSDELKMKNSMGQNVKIKKNATIYVKGYNTDANNDPFLMIRYKDDIYEIGKNDYFFFKYRTEKLIRNI
jgi:hypothetical protein